MKTSVIRYRVADFLREHAPFDVMSLEDLLVFSGGGKVVFHEDDIQLFRKGQTRTATFWVVQQGRIEMLDELPAGDQLRDVLGPGDLIGLRHHADDETYQLTARTATEVILYTFDLSAFETLVGKYPEAGRFLTADLSAAARYTKALQAPVTRERLLTEKEKASWLNAPAPAAEWLAQRLVTCEPTLPISTAAQILAQTPNETLAVTNANGHPLGLITRHEWLNKIAGNIPPDQAGANAGALMNRHFLTAPVGRSTADYLLEMLRGRTQWLALTDNGSAASRLRGVVADTDLEITCGKNPVLLLRALLAAQSVAELAYVWQRVTAFLVESLAGPSVIAWLAQMLSEWHAVLVQRLIQLSEAELTNAGHALPDIAHGWLFLGQAGRREMLNLNAPQIGLVYVDPPPEQAEKVAAYFFRLTQNVAAKLEACGLPMPATAQQQPCRSLAEWGAFFRRQIRDPLGNQLYHARECFDFYVVSGETTLGQALRQVVLKELENSDIFIPLLANDTIANLPPLTFYQGFVLETDGKLHQTMDVGKTALTPITDAARVLAFAHHELGVTNTLERLQRLARALPQSASILTDAAEAWPILCYHHALAGLSQPGEPAVIYPARLSRFEQRLLKTAFDATRRLIELASSLHALKATQ